MHTCTNKLVNLPKLSSEGILHLRCEVWCAAQNSKIRGKQKQPVHSCILFECPGKTKTPSIHAMFMCMLFNAAVSRLKVSVV